jgi:hypothetical protein
MLNRRGPHDDHGFKQGARSRRQYRDQPSVQSAEPWTRRRAAQHRELVAEQEVLRGDDGVRDEDSPDSCDYVAKEVDHRAMLCRRGLARPALRARGPRAEFLRRTAGRGRRGRAPRWFAVEHHGGSRSKHPGFDDATFSRVRAWTECQPIAVQGPRAGSGCGRSLPHRGRGLGLLVFVASDKRCRLGGSGYGGRKASSGTSPCRAHEPRFFPTKPSNRLDLNVAPGAAPGATASGMGGPGARPRRLAPSIDMVVHGQAKKDA